MKLLQYNLISQLVQLNCVTIDSFGRLKSVTIGCAIWVGYIYIHVQELRSCRGASQILKCSNMHEVSAFRPNDWSKLVIQLNRNLTLPMHSNLRVKGLSNLLDNILTTTELQVLLATQLFVGSRAPV